jgi:hypothetical protein
LNCNNSSEQFSNATLPVQKPKYIIDVFANQEKTNTSFSTELVKTETGKNLPFAEPIKFELNGKPIEEKSIESSATVSFKHSAESYQGQNQYTVTDAAGNRCSYDIELEALDFQRGSDVILSRTERNILPLSRAVKEDEQWWLFFRENEGGGFKEIAEFNEQRNSLILPPKWTKRLWVGNVVVGLATGVFKDVNKPECPEAKIHLQYSSEIPATVIKQF